MKHIVAAVSRLRRGGNGKAKETPSTDDDIDNNPYVGSINIIHHEHRGGDNGAGATVSTLTNNEHTISNRRKFGMETDCDKDKVEEASGNGNHRDGTFNNSGKELKDEASSVWSGVVGVDYHLSRREQMWYKNQMYLLAKQKDETAAGGMHTPTRISQRYESSDRRDRYSPGFNKLSDSPSGVDEFESEIRMSKTNGKSCGDPKKEVRFCSKSNIRRSGRRLSREVSANDDDDDDTWTKQSSSLFDGDDTYTNQSSTVFDDDTRTNQSSSLLNEEDDTQFDDVILEETTDEGESLFTSLDGATTSPSYIFQLVDDDGSKQRRKYQLGVGQNPNRSTIAGPPTRRRVTVHAQRGRRGKNSTDDADFVDDDTVCPVLPELLEEVYGTCKDFKTSLDQVMHAFFISEDDVDRMSDKIRDAKLELVDLIKKEDRYGRSILL